MAGTRCTRCTPLSYFSLRIDLVAFDHRDDFLQAADCRTRESREHFHLPALRFGVARVHAEDLGGEQRGFVAAGAGADFEDDVLLVVGILREQQNLQVVFDLADAALQFVELFLRIGQHLGIFLVGEDRLAFGDAASQVFVLAILFDDGRDFAMRLGSLLVFRRVVDDLRRREGVRQFLVAGFDLVEAFKHRMVVGPWSLVVGRSASTQRVDEAT